MSLMYCEHGIFGGCSTCEGRKVPEKLTQKSQQLIQGMEIGKRYPNNAEIMEKMANKQSKKEAIFKKQYQHYGGFCPTCGEALEPVLNEDYETLGLCKYGGKHD